MKGWWPLWKTSVGLGVGYLRRYGFLREAVIRIVVPLDPSRYLELPWALERLSARPGERVLDLASPKLLAVSLARRGVNVTSVDELPAEIERWRALAAGERGLELVVADGRSLPFPDASFDHATSISVLEHIPSDGDVVALRELARCVRHGGRVVVTLPHAPRAWDEFRGQAAYVDHGAGETGHFFQRWYDPDRVDALLGSVPELRLVWRDVVRLQPNLNAAYNRTFPALVPLGPFFGLLARERVAPDGDVARLVLVRQQASVS